VSKVIFDISMSLDGFSAAGNPRPREPTRDGGQVLWGAAMAGDDRDRKHVGNAIAALAAVTCGRTTYALPAALMGSGRAGGSPGSGHAHVRAPWQRRPIAVEVADAIPRTPAATHVRVTIARGTAASPTTRARATPARRRDELGARVGPARSWDDRRRAALLVTARPRQRAEAGCARLAAGARASSARDRPAAPHRRPANREAGPAFDAADLAEAGAPSARRRRAVRRLRAQPLRPRDVAGEGFHDRIGPRLAGGAPGADVHARLNALPARAARAARAAAACRRHFGGPLAYCAGGWEQVDREPFHLVSLDRHRATYNAATPRAPAARPRRARKAARQLGFRLLHLRRRRPTRPRRRADRQRGAPPASRHAARARRIHAGRAPR
jgi:hypothetical protein